MDIPQANMLLISKNAMKYRNACTKFATNINLPIIDYQRISEIDKFYNLCQQQRDFYRDPYGKMKKIEYFDKPRKKFDSCLEPTEVYLGQSNRYVEETQPLSEPQQAKAFSNVIDLRGRYNTQACSKYKR